MAYRSTTKTVVSVQDHLIWGPKYRRRVLVGAVQTRLGEIIGEVGGEHGAEVIEVESMPDHVHLLVEVAPVVPMGTLTGVVKGRSTRLSRSEFPHVRRLPSLRTPSWLLSTVGGTPVDMVRREVDNQQLETVMAVHEVGDDGSKPTVPAMTPAA
jgi:putative transposase